MPKIKYYYDTKTCKYEQVKTTKKGIILNFFAFLATTLALAAGMVYIYQNNFNSIKETRLLSENRELSLKYEFLKEEMFHAEDFIDQLQVHDDSIYRVILDTEPVAATVREAGIGGAERYASLKSEDLIEEDLILNTYKHIDKLTHKLLIQEESFDELVDIERRKEKKWAARPAIQPINNKELIRIASGFKKNRFHPILKVLRPHYGIDFTAPKNTPIYATGDGVIKKRHFSSSFGNVVYIDHGYGYTTVYAHMSKFNVKKGQRVKRGDCIGYVGNTGLSRASHLHYEVHFNNNPIDPINFFHRDLSNDEYEKLIEISESNNTVLDLH